MKTKIIQIEKRMLFSFLLLTIFSVTNLYSQKSGLISLSPVNNQEITEPLQEVIVKSKVPGKILVLDGNGDEYFSSNINDKIKFTIGSAIGTQTIILTDNENKIRDTYSFKIDCSTKINDSSGKYNELLEILFKSMIKEFKSEAKVVQYKDKFYHLFVPWLRDHVHTMKGMKYFYPNLKSGIDLYADSQRDDGMIWDNYTHSYSSESGSYWVQRFKYGNFVKTSEENNMLFTRIPAENDVEYLFIEGIYYTWKATGDTEWMKSNLDKALEAVNYSITNEYRWSEKYKLLKRGYTIDTWDFQNEEDARISGGLNGFADGMVVKPELTRFGIMFGDNTGMAASCSYLAEMLVVAGRNEEAKEINDLGNQIKLRVNKLSWNGSFYTHHISEDTEIVRDLGVNELEQISLSNSYSLNRNIGHEKAVKIIESYLRIKKEMPKTSPGEFYTIYPPFNKGFGEHNSKWNYMNGGVTSIVAGELAHGAFENGYENYGVDILERMHNLAKSTNNYLHCTYRGKMPENPDRTFETISLKKIANADFSGKTKSGVMGWTNEGDNDLHEFPTGKQSFKEIPFDIVNPTENGGRACIGISSLDGYSKKVILDVNKNAKSIYFLHTANTDYYAGNITLHYNDGTLFSDEIGKGKILNWWYPNIKPSVEDRKQLPTLEVAWRGSNAHSDYVGAAIYGLNNPHPEKTIDRIEFNSAKNGTKWMMLGVTLSDTKVLFMPSIVSTGIPDNWGAAAVVYALVEGLAGVKDCGVAFNKITLSPRWEVANENKVSVTIKYPVSNGYVSYNYEKLESKYNITFTGTMTETDLRILIPNDAFVSSALADGKVISVNKEMIENSKYVTVKIDGKGVHRIQLIID